MHSIFLLRCFNDCFAVLALFAAIYCYQTRYWHLGSFFYTTGLNVKMSLLLPLPAMGIMFLQALGSGQALTQAMIIVQVSVSFMIRVSNTRTFETDHSYIVCLRVSFPQTRAFLLCQGV